MRRSNSALRISPQFPIYIPTKGRAEYMITSRVLTDLGIHHFLIVEPQEIAAYAESIRRFKIDAQIVPLDLSYKPKYELCDSHGLSKSTGSGPARNFAWDHSIASGNSRHWVIDDNISSFRRMNGRAKIKVADGAVFRAMEDFVLRYKNVAMAGPNYSMFAYGADPSKVPPFYPNTRIYSCNLIRNDIPFRWRGRYNEDVILSLDMLKAGWATVLFNAFLQNKMRTQTLRGGNTDELYRGGTLAKSQMLVRVHPDVSKLAWKFGRWHHYVDYTPFRRNKLIRIPGIQVSSGIDDYGMSLKRVA